MLTCNARFSDVAFDLRLNVCTGQALYNGIEEMLVLRLTPTFRWKTYDSPAPILLTNIAPTLPTFVPLFYRCLLRLEQIPGHPMKAKKHIMEPTYSNRNKAYATVYTSTKVAPVETFLCHKSLRLYRLFRRLV